MPDRLNQQCNKLFSGNVRLKCFIQNDQKRVWISIIIVQKATEFIFELKCEDKRKGDPVFGQTEKWILFYYSNVIRNRKFSWNLEFGKFITNPMFGFFILQCFAIIRKKNNISNEIGRSTNLMTHNDFYWYWSESISTDCHSAVANATFHKTSGITPGQISWIIIENKSFTRKW